MNVVATERTVMNLHRFWRKFHEASKRKTKLNLFVIHRMFCSLFFKQAVHECESLVLFFSLAQKFLIEFYIFYGARAFEKEFQFLVKKKVWIECPVHFTIFQNLRFFFIDCVCNEYSHEIHSLQMPSHR